MEYFDERAVVIVGYPGRLARGFAMIWPEAQRVGRKHFDITNKSATLEAMEQLQPKIVVNCAAMTDVVRCEREPDMAWAVNVRGVRNLAEACRRVGAFFVHFSSDYALCPVNEYAWTKRASESLADLTIRAKIYDETHWAWMALRAGQSIKMLTTEFLNPITTTGAAIITEVLLRQQWRGVVEVGTKDRLTFWQVGCTWAEVLGLDVKLVDAVERIESAVERPAEMFLPPQSLEAAGIHVPSLAEDAQRHLELKSKVVI
ncbi:MAG: sugar nucleotide-binding protein [Anaerolineae bacterium]